MDGSESGRISLLYVIAGASFNVFFYFFRYSAFMYYISISVLVTTTLIKGGVINPQAKTRDMVHMETDKIV